ADDSGVRHQHADVIFSDLVVLDRPTVRCPGEGVNTSLRHLSNHEISDGHIVDILVVRPESTLRRIGRRPAGSVQDRAVLADKSVAALRGNSAGDLMHAGFQAERRATGMDIDRALKVHARCNIDRVNWTRNLALWANQSRRRS